MNKVTHVFYLDDDPDDHQILQDAAAAIDESLRVQIESDPFRALLTLRSIREKPDLILVDINMPQMTGFEFCEKLKSNGSLNAIPVFFYSTSSDERDIARSEVIGADGYITKSIDFSDLCTTLQYLIGGQMAPSERILKLFAIR